MRVMLVVPEGYTPEGLGENVTLKEVPKNRAIAFDFLPPHGVFLVLTQPENVRDIHALIDAACELAPQHHAVAFLTKGEPQREVLATAAPTYAFDALPLHLAGGLDSTISIEKMCLDAMIRLAGRGVQPIAYGHASITSRTLYPIESYLTVAARNFTPDTQARYLAPVFLATVSTPLHATNTDTSILDLERTPYTPSTGHTPRALPEGSNDGVHTLHEWWYEAQRGNFIAHAALKPFRRRPDALLPCLREFAEEATRAVGAHPDNASILCDAFADTAYESAPRVLFIVDGSPQAFERMNAIRAHMASACHYYDTATKTFYTSSTPGETWKKKTGDYRENACPIVYYINTPVRALAPVYSSDSIVISDFSCTDPRTSLLDDWVTYSEEPLVLGMHMKKEVIPGMHNGVLNESLVRSDCIIARDSIQRDFLLGAIAGLHRLNQYTYDEDLSLSSLVVQEDGTRAALHAIETCLHPFDRVTNNAEYEQTLFDAAAPPPPPPPPTFSQRVVNKAKRTILRGER